MAEKQFTIEDHRLFADIANDIKCNRDKYLNAGEWLDEYYDLEKFWQEKQQRYKYLCNKANNCDDFYYEPDSFCYNPEKHKLMQKVTILSIMIETRIFLPISSFEGIIEPKEKMTDDADGGLDALENLMSDYSSNFGSLVDVSAEDLNTALETFRECVEELRSDETIEPIFKNKKIVNQITDILKRNSKNDGVEIGYRFWSAWDYLSRKFERGGLIDRENVRRAVLVTWLLTDTDAYTAGLGITEFEKSPPCERVRLDADSSKAFHLSDEERKAWMEFVRIACAKSEAEKPAETEQETEPDTIRLDQFTDSDRELFRQIKSDIKKNPDKYSDAGKSIDKYFFSEDEYWNTRKTELKCCLAFLDPNAPKLESSKDPKFLAIQEARKRELCLLFNKKSPPSYVVRLEDCWTSLLMQYGYGNFLSKMSAKKVLLITWLLTDPDAEKANLGLTQFEDWPWGFWESCGMDSLTESRASVANQWLFGSKFKNFYFEKSWRKIIHDAVDTIKMSKQADTGQGNKPKKKKTEAGKDLETFESSKRIAKAYNLPLERVRVELSKAYWGPGGAKANNPKMPQLRTNVEDSGGRDTQYLWHTELVKTIIERLAKKHIEKH